MIADKREFSRGAILMVIFLGVLILMFLPLYGGKNALEFSDALYNSISKQSAYYIPGAQEKVKAAEAQDVTLTLNLDEAQAGQTVPLFEAAGATATADGGQVTVKGDLKAILSSCLDDADAMFKNQEGAVSAKYGYDARRVLFNWWTVCKAMDKGLGKQKLFKAGKLVDMVSKKAVEPAYNYFGIEPQKLTDRLGIVIFSLVFYVIYTLWYGFGIMFLLEGWGMRLEH